MAVAKQVRYSGQVQGVGFRYTARGLAQGFPVSGHVRNLRGGQVELWVEGEPGDVEGFLEALARTMAGYIREQVVCDMEPQALIGFMIR